MKKYLLILFVLCILMYGCKFDRKTEQSSEEHVQSSMQQTENTMPVYSLLTSYDDIYNSYTKEAIDLYDQVYDTNYSEEKILSFAGRWKHSPCLRSNKYLQSITAILLCRRELLSIVRRRISSLLRRERDGEWWRFACHSRRPLLHTV